MDRWQTKDRICLDDVYEGLETFSCGQSFIISEILSNASPLPVKTSVHLEAGLDTASTVCLYPESQHSKDPENWCHLISLCLFGQFKRTCLQCKLRSFEKWSQLLSLLKLVLQDKKPHLPRTEQMSCPEPSTRAQGQAFFHTCFAWKKLRRMQIFPSHLSGTPIRTQ